MGELANGCAAACPSLLDARDCWSRWSLRRWRSEPRGADRASDTYAAWLREHPGAEIICRGRVSAYTRAIKEAAPHAVEVADRWHLLQNLAAAVEKTCHQHRACLRKRVDEVTSRIPEAPPLMQLPLHELPRTPIIDLTRHRHADVQKLVAAGWSISAIARRLHLDRKTVRRFRATDLDQLLASANERQPAGVLEPFKPYLNASFTDSLGQDRGSRQVVRRHLTALRAGRAEPIRADIPGPREITSWIMRPQGTLSPELERRLLDVRIACPDIARACDLARAFAELLGHRRKLNGDDPQNFVNRTRTGAGAQLEISTELRRAMFGTFDGAENRRATAGAGNGTTTMHEAHFWNGFTDAVREAIDAHELGLANAPRPAGA